MGQLTEVIQALCMMCVLYCSECSVVLVDVCVTFDRDFIIRNIYKDLY